MKPDRLNRQIKRFREKKRMEQVARKVKNSKGGKGSIYSEAEARHMRELLKVKRFRMEMLGREPERER